MALSHTETIAATAVAVVISGNPNSIEVVNVDGGGPIWFRFDGTTAAVAADDCFLVPAVEGAWTLEELNKNTGDDGIVTVSVICTASCSVHVRGRQT